MCISYENMRSFNKNFDELLIYLNLFINCLDVIVLTECWLAEGGVGTGLEGFDLFQTDKQRNQNDGVIVYINKKLLATATQITLGDVYGLGLSFTFTDKHFHILAVYRTFDSNPDFFVTEIEKYFDNISKSKMCIFLGDLNLDLLKRDNITDKYLDCLIGGGFVQCIDKPTRVTGVSKSCLDHIFTKYNDFSEVKSAVIQTAITDHYSTGLTITTTALPPDTVHTTALPPPHTYLDYALLTHLLAHSNWAPVTTCNNNVNFCANNFSKIVVNCVESSKKIFKCNSTRAKKLKPWITGDLIRQIRLRDKLNKRVKKQPFNYELFNYYRELKQTLNNSLKQTKRNYYRSKLNESTKNPKKFWGIINELAGRSNKKDSFPIEKFASSTQPLTFTLHKKVADDFNIFFANVGKELADAISCGGDPVLSDSDYRLNSNFTLQPITALDLRRYVYSLRGGSAPGYDGISADVLKSNFNTLCDPLLHIVNHSFISGVFPDCFKLAKVFPLYKSNDITNKNNFRPISLLSVFTKIIEKAVKDQLVFYLQTHNILSERQYGFRRDKNISDALFDINKELNYAISDKNHPLLIFLDLKKAFDSVDRSKLLSKMEEIGIRGNAHAWFTSYLSHRSQFVSISDVSSDRMPVDYGVVQGSNLGPVLFLIYINNISKLKLFGKLFLFADDSLIFLQGKTWPEVKEKAMYDLMIVKKWLSQNVLSLNVSKTKFMPISINKNTDYNLDNLIIHECDDHRSTVCKCDFIEKVNSYKYLGVFFDERLKWNDHIFYLRNKIRKFIFAFKQMNEVLSFKELKMAYYAYVQSLLSFGIIAWGGCYKSILEPLNVAQKTVLKMGFGKCRRYPTDALFAEISVFTVRQLYIKSILINIFKNHGNIFQGISHSHSTRYSSRIGITVLPINYTFSTTNSFYISHVVYRNICNFFGNLKIFECPSLSLFKIRVNEFIFNLGTDNADVIITADYRRA